MLTRNVLLHAREEPVPQPVPLRAGPLTLIFLEGDLRYIRWQDREIVRRVYAAVRDRNWGTVPGKISNLVVKKLERSFEITYDVQNRQGDIQFDWKAQISGKETGEITFAFQGKAASAFLKNRIGLCVLHPIRECAGQPCTVEHSDGKTREGTFPKAVSPNQPFLDMRAISHQVAPGLTATVRLDGDIFEMEDQRNWTDGSYKIYSTPLKLPYPVEIKAGSEIEQSVTLLIKGGGETASRESHEIALTLAKQSVGTLVPIGLGISSVVEPLTDQQAARLRELKLAHLRADLDLTQDSFPVALMRAARESQQLNVPLELALRLSDGDAELAKLAEHLKASSVPIARFLIFHRREPSTQPQWVKLAQKHLKPVRPQAAIVFGTDAFLAELNRQRPQPKLADGVCFSCNPTVHAVDVESIVENAAAQADAVETVRGFGAGPVIVTPVTLKARFNPVATGPEPPPAPGEFPSQVDPRQMSLFGAAWTVASLKYLAESKAASVTYYETAGWRGVLSSQNAEKLLPPFNELEGMVFPVWFVFAWLGAFQGAEVIPCRSSDPLAVEVLVLRKNNRHRALLVNLTSRSQVIRLAGLGLNSSPHYQVLDVSGIVDAMREPQEFIGIKGRRLLRGGADWAMELTPFATMQMDW